jgi:hypothetical protein
MREVEQSVALTSSLSPSSKRIIALLSKKICDFESVNMRLLNPVNCFLKNVP